MDNNNTLSALLMACAAVLQATCWPIIILGGLVLFRRSIQDFFSSLSEFSFKAGASGVEASAKKFEAAASLGAATARRTETGEVDSTKTSNIAKSMESLNAQRLLLLSGKHILWVDDNPGNNTYEKQSLEVFGIRITDSLSTKDAMEKLARNHYDLIITNFKRPDEDQAGYALLDALKGQGIQTPVIIYSSVATVEFQQAARNRGARGQTNTPQALFELVLNALLSKN